MYKILTENKKDYMAMMAPIIEISKKLDVEEEIHKNTKNIIKTMKRKDRIIWFLRCYRYYMCYDLQYCKKIPKKIKSELKKLKEKYKREFENNSVKTSDIIDMFDFSEKFQDIYLCYFIEKFVNNTNSHYYIKQADEYIFTWKSPRDIEKDLENIYKEWQKTSDRQIVPHAKDSYKNAEKIIDFGDGIAWWNLNVAKCEDEGYSMHHCGNFDHGIESDRILSLRSDIQHKGRVKQKTHLTFVINKNKNLIHSKGRNNRKPVKKYHKYIIPLLLSDKIKKIDTYDRFNNFNITDLPIKDQKHVLKQKPELDPDLAKELLSINESKNNFNVIISDIKKLAGII